MGFAVVADEVKNLANRSAEAAKDTAQMIEDSIRKTEEGAALANRLADGFKEILANAQKMAIMAKEVEVSSTQQDTGINQVTQAIIQFDSVVQSNAGTAEESASSAEELASQASGLMDIVENLTILVNGKLKSVRQVESARIPVHSGTIVRSLPSSSVHPSLTGIHAKLPSQGTPRKRELGPSSVIPFEDDEDLINH